MPIADVPMSSACMSLFAAWLVWIVGLVVYRFYFHPLAAFPGPRLAIATYWYEFYFDVFKGGNYTWKLSKLHDQYGPIIRFNPDELHINDPEYFDKAYSGIKGRTQKPLRAAEIFGPIATIFGTVDHDLHRTRRAPLDRLFSKKVVNELQSSIVVVIQKLCNRIQNTMKKNEKINLKYAYNALTRDVIYQYCFSRTLDSVEMADFDQTYLDAQEAGQQITSIIFNLHWFGVLLHTLPRWLTKTISPGFGLLLGELDKMALQIEAIRCEKDDVHKETHHPTIFHDLLNSNLPDKEKSVDRIVNQGIRLKLYDELKGAMPDPNGVLPLQQLEQLPYLTAVVLEGLRIGNISALRLLRAYPDMTLSYGNYTIPAGTTIAMTPLHVHQNKDLFPEPHQFKPDRWLIPEQQHLRRYLVAFAKGKRACLGRHIAWAELYLTLAMVFRRFSFELHDTVKERDYTVSKAPVIGAVSDQSKGVIASVMLPEATGSGGT
ncbi:MAG: hypothetical protein Q9212_003172 [Teloschistes hypoglaucus]